MSRSTSMRSAKSALAFLVSALMVAATSRQSVCSALANMFDCTVVWLIAASNSRCLAITSPSDFIAASRTASCDSEIAMASTSACVNSPCATASSRRALSWRTSCLASFALSTTCWAIWPGTPARSSFIFAIESNSF